MLPRARVAIREHASSCACHVSSVIRSLNLAVAYDHAPEYCSVYVVYRLSVCFDECILTRNEFYVAMTLLYSTFPEPSQTRS